MTAVLDASAVLAYLKNEPGAQAVQTVLASGALISAVNWAEVLARLAAGGVSPDDPGIRLLVEAGGAPATSSAPLSVRPFDESAARETVRIKRASSGAPLSLSDRACLALGREAKLPVLTTDRAWRTLKLKVKIVLVR